MIAIASDTRQPSVVVFDRGLLDVVNIVAKLHRASINRLHRPHMCRSKPGQTFYNATAGQLRSSFQGTCFKLNSAWAATYSAFFFRYDLILHLVTAANGAQQFYQLENNSARTETIEEVIQRGLLHEVCRWPSQAIILDDRIKACWASHPRQCIIDNSTNFEEKLKKATTTIKALVQNKNVVLAKRMFQSSSWIGCRQGFDNLNYCVPILW